MPIPNRGKTFKIFLGNLAEGVSNEDVRPLFEKYGEIVECDIVGSFGFVHMRNADEGKAAIADLNGHFIKGKNMRVEASTSRPSNVPSVKIFVGNLPDDVNGSELRELFEKYGTVMECDVLKNFAFVHMEKGEPSNRAIRELNSYNYHGNPLNVQFSTSRVRTKPGMGQSDQCYKCGRSGHWSKECPAERYGGRSSGFRGPGGFGAPPVYGGSPRYGGSSAYGGPPARGPPLRGPPRRMDSPLPLGPAKMYSRRYEDDFYEGGSVDRYRDSYDDYGRPGYGDVGGYPYEPSDSFTSDYPPGGYGGSSFSDYPPVGRSPVSRGRGGRVGGSRFTPY
ncbi:RNA-binding protein 4.1-like isoform X2 [Artemia franciscana]|uniref:RNA-binding protein 4.1-like isoform X2 n=1 Tax=Artemia franciscana TaxID=6661 RepID=UPI0032DADFEB